LALQKFAVSVCASALADPTFAPYASTSVKSFA
jgi:hypothetical protein